MKRMAIVTSAAMALAAVATPLAGHAQQPPIKFVAVGNLGTAGPEPQVIGANPATPGKWPATFVFRNDLGAGCTATGVGPRTILTAAHCMPNGATGQVTVADQPVTIACIHHPAYPADISADFALCFADANLASPGGGFERVNTDAAEVPVNRTVTLLGYGCRTVGGADKTFGLLYEGAAVVKALATKDNYIRTADGAAVCFGDSGGGSYVNIGADRIFRRVFAVNSRGDISTNSWLSVTHKADFMDWAKKLAGERSTLICGLHSDATPCRQ